MEHCTVKVSLIIIFITIYSIITVVIIIMIEIMMMTQNIQMYSHSDLKESHRKKVMKNIKKKSST